MEGVGVGVGVGVGMDGGEGAGWWVRARVRLSSDAYVPVGWDVARHCRPVVGWTRQTAWYLIDFLWFGGGARSPMSTGTTTSCIQ